MTAYSDAELKKLGCDPDRPVTAYVSTPAGSNAVTQTPPGGKRLITGMTETGFGSAESCLAVAKDGTIFFAPCYTAGGNGVLRSRDNGLTWTPLIPKFPDGKGHDRVQCFMYLDPATERLFFHSSLMTIMPPRLASGFHLTFSDDQGETWNYVKVAKGTRDWAKVYAGPPVTSRTQGYPNALYLTASSPISTRFWPWFAPDHQAVFRSLDGGKSWDKVGKMSLKPTDVPDCSMWEWVIYGNGLVARDGSIYLGFRRGPRFAVAISRDEGQTWTVRDLPGADLIGYFNIMQVGFINSNYIIAEPLAIM